MKSDETASIAEQLFWVTIPPFMVLAAMVIVGLVLQSRFCRLLRERRPEVWRRLGSPGAIRNNRPRNSMRLVVYELREKYEVEGDEELVKCGRFVRWYLIVYIVVFSMAVLYLGFQYYNLLFSKSVG